MRWPTKRADWRTPPNDPLNGREARQLLRPRVDPVFRMVAAVAPTMRLSPPRPEQFSGPNPAIKRDVQHTQVEPSVATTAQVSASWRCYRRQQRPTSQASTDRG